ncbi:hypothetical protein M569_11475, partial [Genlisea aurea]
NGEANPSEHSLSQDEDGIFSEPQIGMEFDSEDAARMFYEEYARNIGFIPRVNLKPSISDGMSISQEFICSRNGSKKIAGEETCEAALRIELNGRINKWVVTKFVKDHAHSIVRCSKRQRSKHKRQFTTSADYDGESSEFMDLVPSASMYASLDGNFSASGLKNSAKTMGSSGYPRSTLGRDAQNLLDYFKKMQAENPGFYYAIQLDEENRMANAFWADSRSRASYAHFGDAVILDTTYRVNRCRVPFAPFTGVNHHGHSILFGCALLFDDSQSTFIWLFKTFLAAMSDRAPVSFTTDRDRAIVTAVAEVFPKSRHCINKWDLLREGQEVRLSNPNFQVDLYKCISMAETVEEFESSWNSVVDKYGLRRNDWLQSIYDARQQWIPVYFRDSFFAAISSGTELETSFFDGYVDNQTTLPMFFKQYERALENSFDKEVDADFDTMCTAPVLRTPSPMEKQASSLYTKRIFAKFQEELVETFVYTANRVDGDQHNFTYRVAKFEDDRKSYSVAVNVAEKRASCSCRMFEHCGILCRHILTVFTVVTNILTLPSHYILKRWTRSAKSIETSDEKDSEVPRSMTTRYNRLCREAIVFSEEASISSKTYISGINVLREGTKTVGGLKRRSSSASAVGVHHDARKTQAGLPETAPSLWPRPEEISPSFNLDRVGAVPDTVLQNFLKESSFFDFFLRETKYYSTFAFSDLSSMKKVVLPHLKSMTWLMENKNSNPAVKIAVINLKVR